MRFLLSRASVLDDQERRFLRKQWYCCREKSMEENEDFSLELGSYDNLDKKVTFE